MTGLSKISESVDSWAKSEVQNQPNHLNQAQNQMNQQNQNQQNQNQSKSNESVESESAESIELRLLEPKRIKSELGTPTHIR